MAPQKKPAEPSEALEVRKTASEAMAVADGYDRSDARGTEGIEDSDVRLPFLAIAQKTSKAIDPNEVGKFIEGLKFMHVYNSETREIYGVGPIEFIPIVLRKRAHLLKENGTLGEPVDWNDPRVTWEGARAAGKEKPEGQQIYDWAVLLLPSMELVVLSLRSTSFGAGQTLNRLVRVRKPSFSGKYTFTVVADKNAKGSFGKFSILPAGKPMGDVAEFAEATYESMKNKVIATQDEDVDPADAGGDAVDGEVVEESGSKDKAPF